MAKGKRTKGQARIYKTLHRKLKIEQHESHYKPRVKSGASKDLAVPAPLVTPVVLLLNGTNIIKWDKMIVHVIAYNW